MLIEVTVERKTMAVNLDPAELNSRIGQYMVASTQRKIKGGIKPDNAPLTVAVKQNGKTLRDRGQLIASITTRSDKDSAIVGTNHIGAKLHQFGGTIKAKKKWLWIPASNWTRTQQRKYGFPPGDVMKGLKENGYSIWFQLNKDSGVVMAEKKLKRKKRDEQGKVVHNAIVVFVLKKFVIIPARPYLFLDELDHKVIGRMMKRVVVPEGGGDA